MGVCPFCSSLSPAWAHSIIGQSGIGQSPIVQSLIGQSQSDQRCFAVSVTDGQFVCLFCSSLSPSWAQSPIGQSPIGQRPIGQSQSDQRCFAGSVRYGTTWPDSICLFYASWVPSWKHLHSLGPSGQFAISFLSLVLLVLKEIRVTKFVIICEIGLLGSIGHMTITLKYAV